MLLINRMYGLDTNKAIIKVIIPNVRQSEGFSVNGSVRAFLFLWARVFLCFSAGLCGCQGPYQRSGALMGYDREIESEL